MRFDQQVYQKAQRHAYNTLKTPEKFGLPNLFKVSPKSITAPAHLIQELAWQNTVSTYNFQFGSNAPNPVIATFPQLNNVLLGENDVYAIYGIELCFGFSSVPLPSAGSIVGRVYSSRGNVPADYSLYTGLLNISIESDNPIQNISTKEFLETGNALQYDMQQGQGFMILNPQRIITGRISKFQVQINLQAINSLTLSGNAVVSCRLHGALGLA